MGARCSNVAHGGDPGGPTLLQKASQASTFLTDQLARVKSEAALSDTVDHSDSEASDEGQATGDQDHVFAYAHELTTEELHMLDEQFASVFEDPLAWKEAFTAAKEGRFKDTPNTVDWEPPVTLEFHLKAMPRFPSGPSICPTHDVPKWTLNQWQSMGREAIVMGRVAVIILAGGLEKRFRSEHPKGMTDIGLLSKKSLFQIFCERIKRLQYLIDREKATLMEQYDGNEMEAKRIAKRIGQTRLAKMREATSIPVYVMTNCRQTHDTRYFFKANENFGLKENQVTVFEQDEVPVWDKHGKVIMSAKNEILTAPGGNGHLFKAIRNDGVLADMKYRGLEQFFVMSVDNLLTKVCDPGFLGYCMVTRADVGIKVVEKILPEEEVGVLARRKYVQKEEEKEKDDEKAQQNHNDNEFVLDRYNLPPGPEFRGRVIEYFEMPQDMKMMRQPDDINSINFCHANICQFVITMDVLEAASKHTGKGHHWVPTSVPYIDWQNDGSLVTPPRGHKNGVRLERFLTDVMSQSFVNVVSAYLVERVDEFAPVKTQEPGEGSAGLAVGLLSKAHQYWILEAGGPHFKGFKSEAVADAHMELLCEVSPLVSYCGEGLEGGFEHETLALPIYIPAFQELVKADTNHATFHLHNLGEAQFVEEASPMAHYEAKLREQTMSRLVAVEETAAEAMYEEASERLFGDDTVEDQGTVKAQGKSENEDAGAQKAKEKLEKQLLALAMVTRLPHLDRLDQEKAEEEERRLAKKKALEGSPVLHESEHESEEAGDDQATEGTGPSMSIVKSKSSSLHEDSLVEFQRRDGTLGDARRGSRHSSSKGGKRGSRKGGSRKPSSAAIPEEEEMEVEAAESQGGKRKSIFGMFRRGQSGTSDKTGDNSRRSTANSGILSRVSGAIRGGDRSSSRKDTLQSNNTEGSKRSTKLGSMMGFMAGRRSTVEN